MALLYILYSWIIDGFISGVIDASEIRESFEKIGVSMSEVEAKKLLKG